MKKTCAALLAGTLILSGCATHQDTGVAAGALLGGAAGSAISGGRTSGTVVGALAGALIGGAIGRTMDEQDRLRAQHALEYNRTHQPYTWRNPDTGYSYTVTPTRTYEARHGQYCREYYTDAVIRGRVERVYGTACRQPDGSWEAVS